MGLTGEESLETQPAPEKYIGNTLSNRELYRKSYLIEFYSDDENRPTDVFTFSLPPENEELTYTQRKAETKTFGGLHVDEYGIDAAKIVLSGSTVNQALKMIYRGNQSSMWLSGEEEIYYLRDLIQKYRSIDSLQRNQKGKIVIYDLSKTSYLNTEGHRTPIKNYWQAFPGDFKIRRSSDRPFTYKYSFEFTGIDLEDGGVFISEEGPPNPELDKDKPEQIQEIMDELFGNKDTGKKGALDSIKNEKIDKEEIEEKVKRVMEKNGEVSNAINDMGNIKSYSFSLDMIDEMIDSVSDRVVGFINDATRKINDISELIALPRTIEMKLVNLGMEVVNATQNLRRACDDLVESCRLTLSAEGYKIPQEVLDQFEMNYEEFKDSITENLNKIQNLSNELVAAAKSSTIPDVMVGNPDPETGGQRIVLSYGYTSVTLKSTDTLESLASQYFGDPDKAIDIATYNGVASLNDLQPGATIRLPITQLTRKISNNRIYARREDRDNYGRDILLTDDGWIVTSASGDYELTSGPKNLSQAVLLRLRESVAKRIRLNAYGIRTNIGDPTAGKAYILSSIELTVRNDPRVSSVDNIRFTGVGDSMNVSIIYRDINSVSGNATGRV
jgi:hypothetical protein